MLTLDENQDAKNEQLQTNDAQIEKVKESPSLTREMQFQRLVLEQRSKIKELEKQIQLQESSDSQTKQLRIQYELRQKSQQVEQLKEEVHELLESQKTDREKISQLKSQIQQLQTNNSQFEEQSRNTLQSSIKAQKNEVSIIIQTLETENTLLQEQLDKIRAQPYQMSQKILPAEQMYVSQAQELQTFMATIENEYMAQIVHFKQLAQMARQHMQQQLDISDKEKRALQLKFQEVRELDQQIEQDVFSKFTEIKQELTDILTDIAKRVSDIQKFKQNNLDETDKLLDEKFDKENYLLKEKSELEKQIKKFTQLYEGRINLLEQELKKVKFEDSQQISMLESAITEKDQENEQLQDSLSQIKEIQQSKVSLFKKENERCQEQIHFLIDQSRNREKVLEESIKKLNQSVFSLHKSFESRESQFIGPAQAFKNWDEIVFHLQQKFDQLHDDLKNKLEQRQPQSDFKEVKSMISKLSEKINELDKQRAFIMEKKQQEKKINAQAFEIQLDRYESMMGAMQRETNIFLGQLQQVLNSPDDEILVPPFEKSRTKTPTKVKSKISQQTNSVKSIQMFEGSGQSLMLTPTPIKNKKSVDLQNAARFLQKLFDQIKELQDLVQGSYTTIQMNQLSQENQDLKEHVQQLQQNQKKNWEFCQEHMQRLDEMIQKPLSNYFKTLNQFQEEVSKMTELRKSIEEHQESRNKFLKDLEASYNELKKVNEAEKESDSEGSIFQKQNVELIETLQKEIQNLQEQLDEERNNNTREINLMSQSLTYLRATTDKKVYNYQAEIAVLKKSIKEQKEEIIQNQNLFQKQIKDLKNDIANHGRVVSDIQYKRLEEKKKYLASLQQLEEKFGTKFETCLNHLETKIKKLSNDFSKRSQIFQQRSNISRNELYIDESLDKLKEKKLNEQIQIQNQEIDVQQLHQQKQLYQTIKQLRGINNVREQQTQAQIKELQEVLKNMGALLQNQHNEKTQLLELIDQLNLQIKNRQSAFRRGSDFSFRENRSSIQSDI